MTASIKPTGRFEPLYDRDADVLYVPSGSPRSAPMEEDKQGFLRKDPRTGELILLFLDYEEHFFSAE